MARKVLNVFKKIGKAYMKGALEFYKPCIDAGVNPFM